MKERVVIDTNILFAALRSANQKIRRTLYRSDIEFFAPKFIIVEIFEHKERILAKAKIPAAEVYEFLDDVIQRITFVSNEFISLANYAEAHRLCRDVDENDTPFLALALELNAKLWSKDEALKNHVIRLGVNNFFTDV